MPLYTAGAIVLRRMNFVEADRIVTLYTREYGKLGAIVKGARRPVSRLAGATELLVYGRYQLATGRTLDVLTQAEVKDSFPRLHGDLSRIAHATYIAELVEKLVEERDPAPAVFDLLLSALYLIERPNDPRKLTGMFELQFMRMLGYEPILDRCLRCREPVPETGDRCFSPSLGGLVCRECGPLPEDALPLAEEAMRAMRALLVADAPAVERMEVSPEALDQIDRVMRWYIRYRSERELKSRAFLQSLRLT